MKEYNICIVMAEIETFLKFIFLICTANAVTNKSREQMPDRWSSIIPRNIVYKWDLPLFEIPVGDFLITYYCRAAENVSNHSKM